VLRRDAGTSARRRGRSARNGHTPPRVRPPIVIEEGRLIAGRHPSALGPEEAAREVGDLLAYRVTLFVDLTQEGELEPYDHLVPADVRYVRLPIRDFSVPSPDQLATTLDLIDAEIAAGGVVYVHCWAGCGRTGVVVGSWLVRHGIDPRAALARIAEARGAGCPQTLEQRLVVLRWAEGH
jgi:protein-tyrosine phosphatase